MWQKVFCILVKQRQHKPQEQSVKYSEITWLNLKWSLYACMIIYVFKYTAVYGNKRIKLPFIVYLLWTEHYLSYSEKSYSILSAKFCVRYYLSFTGLSGHNACQIHTINRFKSSALNSDRLDSRTKYKALYTTIFYNSFSKGSIPYSHKIRIWKVTHSNIIVYTWKSCYK